MSAAQVLVVKKLKKQPLKEKQHKKADENDLTPFS
jgi:hypothetical protein